MPLELRALVVILVISAFAFSISSTLSNRIVDAREYKFWVVSWVVATSAALICADHFVLFAATIVVLCIWAIHTSRANCAFFFVLLFVAPVVPISISGLGLVNRIIDLQGPRILSAVLLLPVLLRSRSSQTWRQSFAADRFVLFYFGLLFILQWRTSNATSVMRETTGFILDILLPYFAFSRTIRTAHDLQKVAFALVFSGLWLAALAVFETFKHWPLYGTVVDHWASEGVFVGYREGLLRASVTAGPIPLGLIIMVAMGALLLLRSNLPRISSHISWLTLGLGLIATLSRGPWLGAFVLLIVASAAHREYPVKLARIALLLVPASFVLMLTPLGAKLFELLPFIGSADSGTIEYRQRLLEQAFEVIADHPLFGNPAWGSTAEMRSMLQGQGIIDVVNTYVAVALNSGLVGLTLFVSIFFYILLRLWKGSNEEGNVGRTILWTLAATLIAVLITIGTVSSVTFVPYLYWSFAGLCVAAIRVFQKSGRKVQALPTSEKYDSAEARYEFEPVGQIGKNELT